MNKYNDMTDEELTRNPPRIISNGSDWLSQREIRISGLKNMTIQYLLTKSKADNKSPVQIIDELVKEKIAVSM